MPTELRLPVTTPWWPERDVQSALHAWGLSVERPLRPGLMDAAWRRIERWVTDPATDLQAIIWAVTMLRLLGERITEGVAITPLNAGPTSMTDALTNGAMNAGPRDLANRVMASTFEDLDAAVRILTERNHALVAALAVAIHDAIDDDPVDIERTLREAYFSGKAILNAHDPKPTNDAIKHRLVELGGTVEGE